MSDGNETSLATTTAICSVAICGGPILFKSVEVGHACSDLGPTCLPKRGILFFVCESIDLLWS